MKTLPLVFSVRPVYLAMFFDGRKRFEFRTRRPSVESGDVVLLYETAPTSAIVATAVVGIVYDGAPARVWELAGSRGGITKAEFDRYFANRDRAVAVELEVARLTSTVPLPSSMAAPQSWARWKGEWPLRECSAASGGRPAA
jgi:predicted transcriptional regulator